MSGLIAGNQRNPERSPVDDYPTHPDWTRALLERWSFTGPIWEPAAGAGAMVAVLEQDYEVRSTDIGQGVDFLLEDEPWAGSIVTNPPYRQLDAFVHHALKLATCEVAMLMPIGALGGQRRFRDLWSVHSPALVLPICSRMRIERLRQDSNSPEVSQFNHVWVVWTQNPHEPTSMQWALCPRSA